MEQYLVIIERGKSNYSAYSPDVPGCVAGGVSVEETLQQMKHALVFHLEGMIEDGDELPRTRGINHYLSNGDLEIGSNDLVTHVRIQLPAIA